MTSKNLFFKRMKKDLEQRIWLPVVFFIIGFLMTEMPLISQLNRWKDRIDYVEKTHQFLVESFFTPASVVTIMVVCVAMVSALSGFLYMHSAKKLDVYHSMPIKRETLFLQQYVYGILYYVVPMLVHVVLCLVICAANGVMSAAVLGRAFGFFLVQLLIYIMCYSVVLLAVCLTGNLVISVLGSVILLVYSLILAGLKMGLMNSFFVTYYGSDEMADVPAFTPVHLIYNMLMEMSNNETDYFVYTDYMGAYAKLIFAAVAYTAIALFLYKKRPTEAAGKTMVFPITEPVVKTMVVFPAAILSGYLFQAIIGGDFLSFFFGCVFGLVIVCPLMEVIFRKDVKAVFSHPLQMVFNGVLVIGVVLILQFDLLGYDTYIPDEKKVESYAVDCDFVPTIRSGYGDSYSYRFDNMVMADNESTRKLLEHAAEFTRPMRRGELEERVERGEISISHVTVKYNLKNGGEVCRSYLINVADEQVMQWLADTYNDNQFKQGVYPVFEEGRENYYMGILLDGTYTSEDVFLSEEEMQRFVDTYRRELTNLTFEEIVSEEAVSKLAFALKAREEGITSVAVTETREYASYEEYEYYAEEYGYLIYPSFKQTLALLKEYGAEPITTIPAENVSAIRISDYSREADDHDGLYNKVVDWSYTAENGQSAEIEEILSSLVDTWLVNELANTNIAEDYIDVAVDYIYEDKEMTASLYFKRGQVPGFVLEDSDKIYEEMERAAW